MAAGYYYYKYNPLALAALIEEWAGSS